MDWRCYGPDAVLIQFADSLGDDTFQRGRALVDELERHPPPGLVEFVPAFTTVLLEFDLRLQPDPPSIMPDLMARLKKAARQSLPAEPLVLVLAVIAVNRLAGHSLPLKPQVHEGEHL